MFDGRRAMRMVGLGALFSALGALGCSDESTQGAGAAAGSAGAGGGSGGSGGAAQGGAGGGSGGASQGAGIALAQAGTEAVHFTHHGSPLLSFGGMSDFIFYAAQDAFDYVQWADWAQAHGMNHVRAYLPFSWTYIEHFASENGGATDSLLFPFVETPPGSRQFDLTQFDSAYWSRFRDQVEYLESRGIIIHLLMINGWQLGDDPLNWGGHFFHPDHNVNAFTDHLQSDRLRFYRSVTDGETALAEAQLAWYRKLVEETHDLDNVYYDLVHETAENRPADWTAMQTWIAAMAEQVRTSWSELEPTRPVVLGMDTGGLEPAERTWIFERDYFDVLIYGKQHSVAKARDWRQQFLKPYIPQEAWDDDGTKYSYRHPSQRVHTRKYLVKFMLAKCQQLDLYVKPRSTASDQLPGYDHNYDPNGWNPFEDDALVLRALWNRLRDYPSLALAGTIVSGPGSHQYVLSAPREALAYLSSATGEEGVVFSAASLELAELATDDGEYAADLIALDQGIVDSLTVTIAGGGATIDLPEFTDDLVVHLHADDGR